MIETLCAQQDEKKLFINRQSNYNRYKIINFVSFFMIMRHFSSCFIGGRKMTFYWLRLSDSYIIHKGIQIYK